MRSAGGRYPTGGRSGQRRQMRFRAIDKEARYARIINCARVAIDR